MLLASNVVPGRFSMPWWMVGESFVSFADMSKDVSAAMVDGVSVRERTGS